MALFTHSPYTYGPSFGSQLLKSPIKSKRSQLAVQAVSHPADSPFGDSLFGQWADEPFDMPQDEAYFLAAAPLPRFQRETCRVPLGSLQMSAPLALPKAIQAAPDEPQSITPVQVLSVEFKRGRTGKYVCNFASQPGQYVVVVGDGGEDIGVIVESQVFDKDLKPADDSVLPRTVRLATDDEINCLKHVQPHAESKCVQVARSKAQDYRLSMTIVDAEYQFDRKKLTLFYDANERVDFRQLVRDLFKLYRARIWMAKI